MATINPFQMWQGSFVPNWLMRRAEVSASAKLVYGRLCQYAGRDGLAYPSMDTLGDEVGIGRRQILRVINQLEELQLIRRQNQTRENGGKGSNTYEFLSHKWINDDATLMSHTHATSMTHKENHGLRESKRINNPIADPSTELAQATPVADGGGVVNFPNNQQPTPQPEPTPQYDPQHATPVPGHKPAQIPTETYETVAAISGRIGTTGIPQTKYMRQLTEFIGLIGAARIVEIVDESIDDIQTASNSWAYICAVIKNNKTPKPKKNKCPECGTMGLRNKQNLKNYGAGRVAAQWVGVAHYECQKCKHRERKGETPIVSSAPDRAHNNQIKNAVFS